MDRRLYAMHADVSNMLSSKSSVRDTLNLHVVRWAKKEKKERTVPRSNPPGLPTGISSGS